MEYIINNELNELICELSSYHDKWGILLLFLDKSFPKLHVLDLMKNNDFIALFSENEIEDLIEILSKEKEHEAVAYVMDYKAKKYGFRQNGEDDLL